MRGAYALIAGEGAPETLRIDADHAGGVLGMDTDILPFATGQSSVLSLSLGAGAASAGWSAPGVLDVRITAADDDIALVRMRLVATDDVSSPDVAGLRSGDRNRLDVARELHAHEHLLVVAQILGRHRCTVAPDRLVLDPPLDDLLRLCKHHYGGSSSPTKTFRKSGSTLEE